MGIDLDFLKENIIGQGRKEKDSPGLLKFSRFLVYLLVFLTPLFFLPWTSEILEFNKQFIEEVLGAGKEVSFESRLGLENAVRGLNDQEILTDWQNFTKSKDPAEAQKNVLILLKALANKM